MANLNASKKVTTKTRTSAHASTSSRVILHPAASLETDPKKIKVHIARGNSKLGSNIYNFSTLPGNSSHVLVLSNGVQVTDIPGTCTNCSECFGAGKCYACNSALRFHNTVIKPWGENTLLARSGALWDKVDAYLTDLEKHKKKVDKFRINVSGEITDASGFIMWDGVAKKHPKTTFCVYTKNYTALEEAIKIKDVGHTDFEPNFVINISQWHGSADQFLAKYPKKFNVFEYDDTNHRGCSLAAADQKRLAATHHCPAVLKDGSHATYTDSAGKQKNITCNMCNRCYKNTHETTAVYSH